VESRSASKSFEYNAASSSYKRHTLSNDLSAISLEQDKERAEEPTSFEDDDAPPLTPTMASPFSGLTVMTPRTPRLFAQDSQANNGIVDPSLKLRHVDVSERRYGRKQLTELYDTFCDLYATDRLTRL
jgi:hypothetical protein